MKPSPEVEAAGLKAYEQAGAFERLQTWRLPVSYGVVLLVPVMGSLLALHWGRGTMAWVQFISAVLFAVLCRWNWLRLKARYEANLKLLAALEEEYGEELSWVKMENHFAALEELQRELEEEGERGRE